MANLSQSTDGGFSRAANTITRPADTTQYTIGDLIANSTTAGSVAPLSFPDLTPTPGSPIGITGARIRKSTVTLTAASVRLHLFSVIPVPSVGDNGVFNASSTLALADLNGYLGYIDMTFDFAAATMASARGVPTSPAVDKIITTPATGGVWGLLVDRGGYTPASGETYTVSIEGVR